jgi:hypothetical protein
MDTYYTDFLRRTDVKESPESYCTIFFSQNYCSRVVWIPTVLALQKELM